MFIPQAAHPSPHSWRSPALGTAHEIELREGSLRYYDRGVGRPIVFVHGWFANANLWRKVVPALEASFRCIVLDMPFGAHSLPMPAGTNLDPEGCARLINGALDALGLTDVTLVGNDSGGAYSQIAVAADPSRVGALVLNACETPYDPFPPSAFAALATAAASPESLRALLEALRDREIRRSPLAFGHLAKRPIEDAASDSYALPCLSDAGVLRDASHVMRSAAQSYVERAAKQLREWERPVLFAWAREDKFFPLENARRFAESLRRAEVVLIDDAYSFTPEDNPLDLAEQLTRFLAP